MAGSSEKKQAVGRFTRQRLRRRRPRKVASHPLVKLATRSPQVASRCSTCLDMDMTLADVKRDELIALLNHADGIRQQAFIQLLENVAHRTTCEHPHGVRTTKPSQTR